MCCNKTMVNSGYGKSLSLHKGMCCNRQFRSLKLMLSGLSSCEDMCCNNFFQSIIDIFNSLSSCEDMCCNRQAIIIPDVWEWFILV